MKKNRFFVLMAVLVSAVPAVAQHHQQMVFDSTTVVMEETGLSHIYHHVRIHMDDYRGCVDNNVVRADYDPQSATVTISNVIVHRADGRKETITNPELDYIAPARSIFWKSSQKMVEVGRLMPGDELEYTTYKKGFTYEIIDVAGSVRVTGLTDAVRAKTKQMSLSIPATVQFRGWKYSVTAIADEAFQGCGNIKSVTIPASVTTIGASAFAGAAKLKTITIKSSAIETVGAGAFDGIAAGAVFKLSMKKAQKEAVKEKLTEAGYTNIR
ncbi:MAG: leucine-rich repeat protein [Bacteroidales bacterium]|nr:leucine-rich repeat protein [Bacteroidales bacterium]